MTELKRAECPLTPNESFEGVPKYILNEGQQLAFDELTQFCLGNHDKRKMTFSGLAGTGKTFTLTRMIEQVKRLNKRINFGVTAPTHKAVRVLKKQSELAAELDFGTIHSFLGLKQSIIQTGPNAGDVEYKPEFQKGKERRIDGVDVLIIDESSMLDDKLFGYIEDEMRSNRNLRVIYTGDNSQIPPVGKKQSTGESNSIPFIPERQTSHQIGFLEITEPQRQAADSPIILYAHEIRKQKWQQHIDFEFKSEYTHALEIVTRDKEAMTALIIKYFKCAEFQEDPDHCKILAWRNASVNFFNKMVRGIIYENEELPKIIKGEKLIVEEPLVKADRIILAKNEDIVANEVDVREIELRYKLIERQKFQGSSKDDPFSAGEKDQKVVNLKVYAVKLINDDGKTYFENIIHEDSQALYESIRNDIKNAALRAFDKFEKADMWREFYSIQSKFLWVGYNYALTVHKSQGSSYNYCISNDWDIATNQDIEERNRIRYVAATRARHKLFIVK